MRELPVAVAKILRPVIRLLIARGVRYGELSDWLKAAYLWTAERYFRLDGKRLTDSRLHLLTGLQRRDIARLRAADAPAENMSAGPLPRVVALWLARHGDGAGGTTPLPRQGPRPSFEALVAEVSRDMHPRTMLDELLRLELVQVEGDAVHLTGEAFVPAGDEAAMLGYLGANLADHAAASVENILAAPKTGPHLERAVHYNRLTPEAVDELERLSRMLLIEALSKVNARAAALQRRDRSKTGADGRFRAGAYVYRSSDEDSP